MSQPSQTLMGGSLRLMSSEYENRICFLNLIRIKFSEVISDNMRLHQVDHVCDIHSHRSGTLRQSQTMLPAFFHAKVHNLK